MRKVVCSLCFCLFSVSVFSQNLSDADFSAFLNKKFKIQTFYINQFMDRFNFLEPMFLGNTPVNSRRDNIMLLLNRHDTSFMKSPLLKEFVDKVSSDSAKILLNRFDENWFAVATGNFMYKSKPVHVDMKLVLLGNNKTGYSWLIDSVSSKLFQHPQKNYTLYINPLNNEINFSDLSNGLENAKDVWSYANTQNYNPLISFHDYVRNGDLVFTYISKVRYYFLSVAGYDFTVDYYMRTDMNAGWLISSISKSN